jgi:hypothetical protein
MEKIDTWFDNVIETYGDKTSYNETEEHGILFFP